MGILDELKKLTHPYDDEDEEYEDFEEPRERSFDDRRNKAEDRRNKVVNIHATTQRAPKIAVPTRTMVAPFRIASSKSPLMPIERHFNSLWNNFSLMST